MKTGVKKLTLSRETIRVLQPDETALVGGGAAGAVYAGIAYAGALPGVAGVAAHAPGVAPFAGPFNFHVWSSVACVVSNTPTCSCPGGGGVPSPVSYPC